MLLEQMSDEDLIFLIRSGSKVAEVSFYKRYSEYSRHAARTYHSYFERSGISEDEFYAVAFSKTHEVLSKYDNIDKCFYVYWRAIVKNSVYDYVRDNSYQSGARIYAGISLDDTRYENNETLSFNDIIGENERIDRIHEFLKEYLENDHTEFTKEEKMIIDLLFFKGYTRMEIVGLLGYKKSRVNYLARRVSDKLQRLLKENYL